MKWPRVCLGDLVSLEYGRSLPANARDPHGKFPVAGSNGPHGRHTSAFVSSPGIVVGRKGSAGRVYWYEEDFWPIDTTYYVVPKTLLDMRWMYFRLRQLQLNQLATTTGVPGLNRNDVYKIKIDLPPVSEQRRIVDILDHADHLRHLRAEADAKAARILPALFIKMFGDPVTNPMGWSERRLGDIGDLDRGRSRHRPRNDPSLLGGSYPLVQTGDIANSGGRITRFTQTYSELGLAQSKIWPAGTLCITIAANIASTGVLEFDACFPDSVVGFIPSVLTTTEYVQFLLAQMQNALEGAATQVAQKNINLEILRKLVIPVPPKELQDRFSSHVRVFYECRTTQALIQDSLDRLFANAAARAFSGKFSFPS